MSTKAIDALTIAFWTCDEARELLSPLEKVDWETRDKNESLQAVILAKWTCERVLTAYADAAGLQVESGTKLSDLAAIRVVPELHRNALVDLERVLGPENWDTIGPYDAEHYIKLASAIREIVIQSLVILRHRKPVPH